MRLRMESVYKNFKDKEVLKGITVRMEDGVYGLLGPNGAGKTTMIRILADILQPSKGQVFINGQDKNTCGDEYRARIGYLPQDMSFYPDFSGGDYLCYVTVLKGLPAGKAETRIAGLAASVGLANDLRRRCVHYSGGMKRRLGIAQVPLNNPHILILDELTAGLDPQERIKFRNIISAFSKDQIVLLSTHIVSDVDSYYGTSSDPSAKFDVDYARFVEHAGEYYHGSPIDSLGEPYGVNVLQQKLDSLEQAGAKAPDGGVIMVQFVPESFLRENLRMKKTIAIVLFVLYYLISVMFFRIITVFAVGIHWKRKQQMADI
ncbi:MAG: ATP-binding cassette domain-containing protein [Treponema sp.]|jgi:ABC-type Na+ transport system ATPase subunit NatA|nr:ATP-binding cassette domain-containing protein [Treponema sp.]